MAKTLSASPLVTIKNEYIEMDLSPKTLRSSFSEEFEFTMCSNDAKREKNADPVDELFYKGNFLHVQLPTIEEFKGEIAVESISKMHWPKRKRNKFFKQTQYLGSKIKASRDYIKSLFTKSKNSIEERNQQFGAKVSRDALDSTIDGGEKFVEEGASKRKSFSGVIRRRFTGKSSQVSMCSSSDLNRWLEEESSIQGAIAYCKRTHDNLVPNRRSVSDVSFGSFVVPPRVSVGCENQEREKISRG